MDLSNKPPLMRVLCAEPLEGRWLLSGTAPADDTQVSTVPTVTLSDPEKIAPDEQEEGEFVIDESDLPANVLAAFKAAYQNAEIDEVRQEEDDERGIEYGITTETDEGEVEVTISPEGTIVETEREIDPSELPQHVLDEFYSKHQDAEITGASDNGGGSYEVLYREQGVDWELDAEARVASAPPAPAPVDEEPTETPQTPTAPALPVVTDAPILVASSAAADPVVEAEPTESAEVEQVARADTPATDAEAKAREDVIKKNAAAKVAAATTLPADDRTTRAMEALAAGVGANIWLPEVAGALINVLPINLQAIEHSMQDVLRQVGSLGGKVKGESALASGATRLAMTATLVAAVKVLLNQSKRATRTRPALVFGPGAASSWGWVLGTTDARRRRQVPSRLREP